MIVKFKIFHEKTDSDYEKYSKLWDENKERFIITGYISFINFGPNETHNNR